MPPAPTLATLIGTIAIIALFWLTALYVTKKFRISHKFQRHTAKADITIIATKPIGFQSSLLIVEAEGQRFLLSAGRHGLTPIGALNHPLPPSPPPLPASLTAPLRSAPLRDAVL